MGEYSFSLSATHCSELLMFMDEQRKQKDENLCDVCFTVGNDCVYAHRSILAVCSAYFQGLLSGAFSESQGEEGTKSRMMEMDLTDSVSNIAHLETLLSGIYTGSLKLSHENITGVTELACFLLVERVRSVCETFMLETLTLHTCLLYLKLSHHYDLTQLFQASRQLLQFRFHDYFIHQPDMLTVSALCLERLPQIYKYVHQQDVVQFLALWVGEGVNGGDLCDGREERLSTAMRILNAGCQCLKTKHFDTTLLTGNKNVISSLLGFLHKGSFPPCSCSLEFRSAENSEICECSGEDFKAFASGFSSCEGSSGGPSGSNCQAEITRHQNEEIIIDSVDSSEAISGQDTLRTSCSVDENEGSVHKLSCSHNNDTDKCSSHCHKLNHNLYDNDSSNSCHKDSHVSNKTPRSNIDSKASHCHLSLKRDLGEASHLSNKCQRKKCKLSAKASLAKASNLSSFEEERLCDVLMAFVPKKKVVSYFTATDCEKGRPRSCSVEFEVCLYHIHKQRWLWLGTAMFPEKFEERDAWKVACVNCKAYFISLYRQTLHVLDLKTWTWTQLNCRPLCEHMSSTNKIRSLTPIAVSDTLYVLASDREWQEDRQTYLCKQRYFMLDEHNHWQPVADAKHLHTATPLTVLSVSNGKVYTVKATVAINLDKSVRIVQEGHIFNCAKGEVTQFHGTTYAASPMRVLVNSGEIHIVDGDSHHRRMLLQSQTWEDLGKVDLSDIKIGRATSGESFLPCLTQCSSAMGSSVWELSAVKHCSALTELRLEKDNSMFTVRHPPPPFCYVTITTATQLSAAFVSSLKPCRYLHGDCTS